MLTKIHTEFYSWRSFDFFPLEFIVQIYELKQKASIDLYRPFLSDVFQSCQSIPVVAYHQVNDYKCRGSGFAKDAVDEYFAFLFNRVIHEFRSVRKMPKEEKKWYHMHQICVAELMPFRHCVWKLWMIFNIVTYVECSVCGHFELRKKMICIDKIYVLLFHAAICKVEKYRIQMRLSQTRING